MLLILLLAISLSNCSQKTDSRKEIATQDSGALVEKNKHQEKKDSENSSGSQQPHKQQISATDNNSIDNPAINSNTINNTTTNNSTINKSDPTLDLLTDYDRDMWDGPDNWTDNQWQWKKRLKWDKECDYLADISVYSFTSDFQLIQVQCLPGSYQPMSYLFTYQPASQQSEQLALWARASGAYELSATGSSTTESSASGADTSPKAIWGHINIDQQQQSLSILSLDRAVGDCGIYRVFNFETSTHKLQLQTTRKQSCPNFLPPEDQLEQLTDPANWPVLL